MESRSTLREPLLVRLLLVLLAAAYVGVMLVLPLMAVLLEAFADGLSAWLAAITEPDALSAIRLTLLVAAIAVPLNLVFGIAAAWAIAKYEFRGRALLLTLIEIPFSVSPVVSGLVLIFLPVAAALILAIRSAVPAAPA